MNVRLLSCLCWLAPLCASARADSLDDWVRSEMSTCHIPGVVLGVYRDGKPLTVRAYGVSDIENQVPATPDTVFEIGSITKQFTATAILMLEEAGKLSLDDSIRKYIQDAPSSWQPITLRQILSHTSGLPNVHDMTVSPGDEAQTVRAMAALPLVSVPGERWSYCNSGYVLLGYIVEKVSGMSYWDFVSKRILAPLGMTHTQNSDPVRLTPHRAHGYIWNGAGWQNQEGIGTAVGFSAGSLTSTVGDLALWDQALADRRLLSSPSMTEMLTCQRLASGENTWTPCAASYGLGFFLRSFGGHRAVMHSGGTRGFSTQNTWLPDDHLSVIVLTNEGEWDYRPFAGLKVANAFVPAVAPTLDGCATADAATNTKVRAVVAQWMRGKLDLSAFTPAFAPEATSLEPSVENLLHSVPAGFELQCVECVPQGSRTDYRYRLKAADTTLQMFLVMKAGKIESFEAYKE